MVGFSSEVKSVVSIKRLVMFTGLTISVALQLNKKLGLEKIAFRIEENFILRVWSTKFQAPQTVFMVIFELSGIDYPRKHLRESFLPKLTKPKKYHVYVLNFCQIWFSQNSISFQTVLDIHELRPANIGQRIYQK